MPKQKTKTTTKPKPKRNPNLLPTQNFTEDHFKPYAEAIGRATLAWNSLHEALGLVFWAITGEEDGFLALGLWNEIRVDRTKRDILLAAIKATQEDSDKWRKQSESVDFLCVKSGQIEDSRNNAVHSPLSFSLVSGEVLPSVHQGNARAIRLNGHDVLKEFERLYETALLLRDYALVIEDAFRAEPSSWPEIPKLPDPGGSKKNPQRPLAVPVKQSRRPQPSLP
jgi:hypothetical protein